MFGFQVEFGAGAQQGQGWQGDPHGSGQILLYDGSGNPLVYADKSKPTTPSGLMRMGLAGGMIARAQRADDYSDVRITSEVLLFQDAIDNGSTINSMWSQVVGGSQTITQAGGIITLNASGITGGNSLSLLQSLKQFPKYPRQPLYCKFRARISTNITGNFQVAELGIGNAVTNAQIVPDGAFFRWTTAGNLNAVISYNSTETSVQVLAQGVISTTSYYDYEVIVDDDFARFILTDPSGTAIVDTQIQLPLSQPCIFSVSHLPSYARTYVTPTSGATPLQWFIAGHTVQLLDAATAQPWADQLAGVNRYANIGPAPNGTLGNTTGFGAAPTTLTPSNAGAGVSALGGEYAFTTVVASELPCAIFAYSFSNLGYEFLLTGLQIPPPVVATTIATTGIAYIEWMIAVNAASNSMSAAGAAALFQGTGIVHTSPGIAATQGQTWSGVSNVWEPKTPILCRGGSTLLIGFKILGATVVTTAGLHRGTVTVDGYWM